MKGLLIGAMLSICFLWSCGYEQAPFRANETCVVLDSLGVDNPALMQIVDYNGNILTKVSYTDSLPILVNGLIIKAKELSGLKKEFHREEGQFKPAHYGLAYSFGQRDITQRLPALYGNDLHKSYWVYGTDCSGLMLNLLWSQNVSIMNTTVSNFERHLSKSLEDKKVKLVNLGNLPVNQTLTGDFVVWKGHIGIISVLRTGARICFQSNGNETPVDEAKQIRNMSPRCGVHPMSLDSMIFGERRAPTWGNTYSILRMKKDRVLSIGDSVAGGRVFSLDSSGQHGFVCSSSDLPNLCDWNHASVACTNYKQNGYFDWVLPSMRQLQILSAYKEILGGFGDGTSSKDYRKVTYWSEQSRTDETANAINIRTGFFWGNMKKTELAKIRAVRRF